MKNTIFFTVYISMRQWLERLQLRERRAVILLVAFCLCVFLWKGIWQPLENMRYKAEASYITSRTALAWMQVHAQQATLAKKVAFTTSNDTSLLSLANDAAQEHQLAFSHAEPVDNNRVHITLENAGFSNLLLWLESLERDHGITLTQIDVQKQELPGMVNASVTLQTP